MRRFFIQAIAVTLSMLPLVSGTPSASAPAGERASVSLIGRWSYLMCWKQQNIRHLNHCVTVARSKSAP